MTIYGPDVSSYQAGLDLSRLTDAAFVIAKATEGTYYVDADYEGWRLAAKAAGKLFIPYHFISGEDPGAQAAALGARIGDTALPVMLDWEPTGGYSPTLAQLYAVADAMAARGLRVRLAYMPRWYWSQLGGPDLSGLTARRLGLISSAYPGGMGTAQQLYPGDGVAGWQPYGGVTPLIYQFTDQASDGGQQLDMNAYKGTAVALAAFLGAPVPTPNTGATMAVLDHADAITVWAYSHGDSPDVHQTLTNAAAHAASADTKLDQLLARVAPAATVDVDALAAALAPHIAAGASADEVAHAVVMHLGADLQAG